MLLQALNDQNQAAIDKLLASRAVKNWINRRALLPEQLENPIRQIKDVTGITCLAFACLVSYIATVRQLVEAGAVIAETNSRCEFGEVYSALHYACASDIDSDAKLAYLIQRDASLQTVTGGLEQMVLGVDIYSTSLRLAAEHNQAGRLQALIDEHGASVNFADRERRTALHHAAAAGSTESVQVLVHYPSCDINITDDEGLTAANLARRHGQEDIAVLIDAKSKGTFLKCL